MCVCVAVELHCYATALILVIGKAQFRRAMLSCDSSCYVINVTFVEIFNGIIERMQE